MIIPSTQVLCCCCTDCCLCGFDTHDTQACWNHGSPRTPGRLQLAEQQVRMYREAMEHLMSAPNTMPTSGCTQDTNLDVPEVSSITEDIDGEKESNGQIRNKLGRGRPSTNVCGGSAKDDHVAGDDPEARFDGSEKGATGSAARVKTQCTVGDTVGGIEEDAAGEVGLSRVNVECRRLEQELEGVMKRRAVLWTQTDTLARARAELERCRRDLLSRGIALNGRRSDLAEESEGCRSRRALYSNQLVSAMNMGALNDCFHIWHQGPFATINGFRVGRLQAQLVDWQEVNAAVGQAAIVLVTVAMAMGVKFSKYLIAPCGSFTKIARSEDGRVLYSLHTDESFSLFPRRNFNLALKAFLHCLGEVGDHVQEHDPTLQLPYHIKEKEGTIGGLSVALGSSLEDWTRALKYMITDLKWIAAWAAKYLPPC